MSDDKRDILREWFDTNIIRCVSGTGVISAETTFGPIEVGAQATWNVISIKAGEVRGGRGVPRLDDAGAWWQPPAPEDDE